MVVFPFIEILYFVGSILFIPGSILLYWPDNLYAQEWCAGIFIFACVLFLIGGVIDLAQRDPEIDAWFYFAGGIAFTVGSVLFWPSFPTGRAGIWVFRCGSLCYVTGSLIILATRQPRIRLMLSGTANYAMGSTLFVTGGIISEAKGPFVAFATVWTIGSVFFTIGATFHLLCAFFPSLKGDGFNNSVKASVVPRGQGDLHCLLESVS